MDKKYLKRYVNTNYFEIPSKGLKSKFLAFKYQLAFTNFSSLLSDIYICNKTSPFDKILLSNCIEGNYVYLKDSVVEKIYSNSFDEEEKKELLRSFNKLKTYFISVVIFPERHTTIFGDYSKIPKNMTDFIYDLKFDKITFVNLIGSYFIHPIWADTDRICRAKIDSKFSIDNTSEIKITKNEFFEFFNKYIPSSSSVYSKKLPPNVRGGNLAEHLERVLYFCPSCKNFLTMYSEFNCVKCKNCGSALEINENYKINLTEYFTDLDGAKNFQYANLSAIEKNDEKIVIYNDLNLYKDSTTNPKLTYIILYQDKFEYEEYYNKITVNFDEINDVYLDYKNTLKIKLINGSTISFQSPKNENLYIMIDLLDIYRKNN